MQEISCIGDGRGAKPSGDGEVTLRLTTAGCCYDSLAGGTGEGGGRVGQVRLVESGATAEPVWQVLQP